MSIRFDNVIKSFGENTVLSGVSLAFEENTLYLLTGPSGSGKTTLLRALSGLASPDSGTITHDGVSVSYAFQETRLFPELNVRENVLVCNPRVSCDEILHALDLHDAAEKHPHELSGGMRKRAELARALAASASVYLLDEPTAGQDPERAHMIAEAIRKYTQGATVVISTHDAELIASLNGRILCLESGKLVSVN